MKNKSHKSGLQTIRNFVFKSQNNVIRTGLHIAILFSMVMPNMLAAAEVLDINLSESDPGLQTEGTPTATATPVILAPGDYQESEIGLEYLGSWELVSAPGYIGEQAMVADEAGDDLSFSFTGNKLVIYRYMGPDRGIALICIDGNELENCDLYDSYAPEGEDAYAVPIEYYLEPGTHTVEIKHTGSAQQAATDDLISIDQISIEVVEPTSTPIETEPPIETETPTPTQTPTLVPTTVTIDPGIPTSTGTPTLTPDPSDDPTTTPSQTQTETPVDTPTDTPTPTGTTTPEPVVLPAGIYQEDAEGIEYLGTWNLVTGEEYLSEQAYLADEPGDELSFNFTGDKLIISRYSGPDRGIALICFDGAEGEDCQEYDSYALEEEAAYGVPVEFELEPGTHTVSIRYRGDKHADATAALVSLDQIEIIETILVPTPEPKGLPAGTYQEDAEGIEYTGIWEIVAGTEFFGAQAFVADEPGDELSFSFTGDKLIISRYVGPDRGIALICFDGVEGEACQGYDSYAPEEEAAYGVPVEFELEPGTHTVSIGYSGARNAQATAALISIDQIEIEDTILVTPEPIVLAAGIYQEDVDGIEYQGNWEIVTGLHYFNEQAFVADEPGDELSFSFTGDKLIISRYIGPDQGIALICFDGAEGEACQSYDSYAPEEEATYGVPIEFELEPGTHTVLIQFSGTMHATATGNLISIDQIEIIESTVTPLIQVATRDIQPEIFYPQYEHTKLEVYANPAILLPDTSTRIFWQVLNWDNLKDTKNIRIDFTVPEELVVLSEELKLAMDDERFLTLPMNIESGYIDVYAPKLEEGPYYISFDVYSGKELLDSRSIMLSGSTLEVSKEGGQISGLNGKLSLQVNDKAFEQDMVFDIRYPGPNTVMPVSLTGFPVEVLAVGKETGMNEEQFRETFTIQFAYEEDGIFDWNEEDLKIFYYDPDTRDWWPIATTVDTENNTLTAETDHLTVFDFKADTWQAATIPSVDSFQVASFTGAATYGHSFWVPPGPAGLQPSLSMSYNSQTIDNSTAFTQSSWVGMGWSLDFGSITRNMHDSNSDTDDDTFSISAAGISGQLLPVSLSGDVTTYKTSNEGFAKIEFDSGDNTWTVWDKGGTKYIFGDTDGTRALTNGGDSCVTSAGNLNMTWMWSLSKVTNIYGETLEYKYTTEEKAGSCLNEIAVHPQYIEYPHDRYRIYFVLEDRTDFQSSWEDTDSSTNFSTKRLNRIEVQHDPNGTSSWTVIRQYDFSYSSSASNQIYPAFEWTEGGMTTTLISIQEKSGDGQTVMPKIEFTYGDDMHLTKVDNGQGGTVEMTYERWTYFDDINDDLRSLYVEYGNHECDYNNGSWVTYTPWSTAPNGYGVVRCDPTEHLQIGNNDTEVAKGGRTIPQHIMKPGGRFRYYLQAKAQTGSADVSWAIHDDSQNETYWVHSDDFMQGIGSSSYVDLEAGFEMPVDFDPLESYIQIFADDCFFKKLQFMLQPLYYRVTTKTVTDDVTDNAVTYTYDYDNPAPNDAYTSNYVANSSSPYSNLYQYPLREFRGHAMVQVVNSEDLATITWFDQGDYLKGTAYRTMTMERDFFDNFSDLDKEDTPEATDWSWNVSTGGAVEANGVKHQDYEYSILLNNPTTDSNTYLYRDAYSISDGESILVHVRLTQDDTETPTADIGLETSGGQYFGVQFAESGGDYSAKIKYDTGGGLSTGDTLLSAGDVEFDKWYAVLLMVDNDDGFVARIWQLDYPLTEGEGSQSGFSTASWRGVAKTSDGKFWVDAYTEGTFYTENETEYAGKKLIDNSELEEFGLDNYSDLDVYWSYVAKTINRTYDGDAEWYGTKTVYTYDVDGNGDPDYGNVEESKAYEWTGSAWLAHHATKTEFYPADTSSVYLVSLPALQATYDCPGGSCDYDSGDLLTENLYIYDSNTTYNTSPTTGSLTKIRTRLDSTNYTQTTMAYDTYGNQTSVIQYTSYGTKTAAPTTGSQTTTTSWDTTYHTYPVSMTNSLSQIEYSSYDYSLGALTGLTNINGVIRTAVYDDLGRLTAIVKPGDTTGSPTIDIEYYDFDDSTDRPYYFQIEQKINSIDSLITRKFFSGIGQLLQQAIVNVPVEGVSGKDILVDYGYDDEGRLVKQTIPYDVTTGTTWNGTDFTNPITETLYDIIGRTIEVEATNNAETTMSFDELITWVIDPLGNRNKTTRNVWGQVMEVLNDDGTDPIGPKLTYTYDTLGRLTDVVKGTSPSSSITSITYDGFGRKTEMDDPDMGEWEYTYNALGNLLTQTDARGCVQTMTYDSLNRLTKREYSGPEECGKTIPETYTYDAFVSETNYGKGLLTGMSDEIGTTSWEYDNRGRMTKETKVIVGAGTYVTEWEYNSADQITSVTYPNGEEVTYTYNDLMQLTGLSSDISNTIYLNDAEYDEVGRLTLYEFGSPTGNLLQTEYDYYDWTTVGGNSLGRLESITSGLANDPDSLQDLRYTYDSVGNILTIKDYDAAVLQQTQTFEYDDLYRLTDAEVDGLSSDGSYDSTYTYDAYGRLSTKDGLTLVYDVAGHIHAAGSMGINSYEYDENGNMIERMEGHKETDLIYDGRGKLILADYPENDEVFSDDFEDGTLDAWTSYFGSWGGIVSINSTTPLAGSYDLDVYFEDERGQAIISKTVTGVYDDYLSYHTSFIFDPSSLTMGTNEEFSMHVGSSYTANVYHVKLGYDGTNYRIYAVGCEDSVCTENTSYYTISSEEHSIQVDWAASTGAGNDDGYLVLSIDGVQKEILEDLDNDTLTLNNVKLGVIYGPDPNTIGHLYFDNFESWTEGVKNNNVLLDDFEDGDISDWDYENESFGTVSVNSTNPISGDYDIKTSFEVGNGGKYAWLDEEFDEEYKEFHVKFLMDISDLNMNSGDDFFFMGANNAFYVMLRYDGSNYQLYAKTYDNCGGSHYTSYYTISQGLHEVQIDWAADTYLFGTDDYMTLSIDGEEKETISGLQTENRYVNKLRIGPLYTVDYWTYGDMYFDEIESWVGDERVSDELFEDGFETGDFLLWDDYEEDDSDLVVTSTAAMEGDDGLSVTIDDTDSVYVFDQSPDDETEYHLEFWLDPNSLTMAANDQFTLITGKNSIGSALFKVNMAYIGGVYKVTGVVYNDSATTSWTSYAALTDGPNKIRIDWGAANESGADNGYMALWVDDVFHEQVTGVDNDTHELEYFYAGANGGMDAGTSGSFYLDGFSTTNALHDFLYDGSGSRVLNTLDGEYVVYIGGGYELNVSTGVEKTYYNGFAMREHDLDDTNRTNDSILYLFKDHLGGTNVVSNSSGTEVSETMYMAFGEVRYMSGVVPTDMLYTGQRNEASLNLFFYNARWYDPALGRFTQADTVLPNQEMPLSFDRFAYANNKPTRIIDPDGHRPLDPGTFGNDLCDIPGNCTTGGSGATISLLDLPKVDYYGKPPIVDDSNWWTDVDASIPENELFEIWFTLDSNEGDEFRANIIWEYLCSIGSRCPNSKELAAWLLWQEGGYLLRESEIDGDIYNHGGGKEGVEYMVAYFKFLFEDSNGITANDLARFTAFFNPEKDDAGLFDEKDWNVLLSSPIDLFFTEVDLYWNSDTLQNIEGFEGDLRWWTPDEGFDYDDFHTVTVPGKDDEVYMYFGLP